MLFVLFISLLRGTGTPEGISALNDVSTAKVWTRSKKSGSFCKRRVEQSLSRKFWTRPRGCGGGGRSERLDDR
jgi:hypothetical protein